MPTRTAGRRRSSAGSAGKARVIAEGLGGRTTVHDDWCADADRNGARILPTLLASHSPLDLVVIMLGTNDMKPFLGAHRARSGERRAPAGRDHPRTLCAEGRGDAPGDRRLAAAACDTDHPDLMRHFGGFKAIVQSKEIAALVRASRRGARRRLLRCLDRREDRSARRRPPRRGQHARDRRGARAAGQAGARPVTRDLHPPGDASPMRARSRCWSTSRRMAASRDGWARDEARRGHLRARSRSAGCDMLDDETEFSWRKRDHRRERRRGRRACCSAIASPTSRCRSRDDVPTSCVPINELEAERPGAWFVSMLGVHIRWRGRGVGSALLDVADDEARRDRGARPVADRRRRQRRRAAAL